jgi:hypothetical protein
MFSTLLREVRFALRGLLRDRGFAVTALLSIGLGVGANAAIFSLVDQALFRLLAIRETWSCSTGAVRSSATAGAATT